MSRRALARVLIAMVAFGLARDAWLMFRYPVALGTDGYYYVVQTQQLLLRHTLHYPTPTPAALYVAAGLAGVIGDAIVALKIVALVLDIVLTIGVFAILRMCTGRTWCGALSAVLFVVPTMHQFYLVEFLNNLAALALLTTGAVCLLRAKSSHPTTWRLLAAVAVAGSLACHRMAWVLVPVGAILYAAPRAVMAGRGVNGQRAIAAAAVAVVWAATWFAAAEWGDRFSADMQRFPEFPLRLANPTGGWEVAVLLLAAPCAIWIAPRGRWRDERLGAIAIATALWTLMFTLNPWLSHDMSALGIPGRFDHAACLQVALLVPALLAGAVVDPSTLRIAEVAGASLLAAATVAPIPNGARAAFVADRERLIAGLRGVTIRAGERIVAPHGDEFLCTRMLGVEASHRYRPSPAVSQTYWLIRGAPADAGMLVAEEGGTTVSLVPHDQLLRLDAAIDPDARRALRRRNRHWGEYRTAAEDRRPQ